MIVWSAQVCSSHHDHQRKTRTAGKQPVTCCSPEVYWVKSYRKKFFNEIILCSMLEVCGRYCNCNWAHCLSSELPLGHTSLCCGTDCLRTFSGTGWEAGGLGIFLWFMEFVNFLSSYHLSLYSLSIKFCIHNFIFLFWTLQTAKASGRTKPGPVPVPACPHGALGTLNSSSEQAQLHPGPGI